MAADENESLRDWIDRLPGYSTPAKRKLVDVVESQLLFSVKDLKEEDARALLPPGCRNEMSAAGMFRNSRSDAVLRRVRSIADSVAALLSVDFEEVKVFDKLPWPSLQPSVPHVSSETDGIWLVGRPVFKDILDRFTAARKNDEISNVIDLDGNVGSGKTYLLLMLALHCLHTFSKGNGTAARKSRLVCIFRMPEERSGLLTAIREALLVAFAEDTRTCNRLCCITDWEEMMEVVTWLKDTNDLFFVIDEYNVLDDRTSNSSLMEVWLTLETLEESSTCLHARRNEALSRAFKSTYNSNYLCKYTAFTPEEIKQYITRKGLLSEPGGMQALTGGLPLMVRLFVDCYVAAASSPDRDNEAREKFLCTRDVEQQRRTLEQWVMDIAALEPVRRRRAAAALSDLITGRGRIDSDDFNPRWIVQNGDKFALVSDLAKEMVVAAVGMHFGKADGDALMMKVAEQLIEECMAAHPVPSLVGLMVELVVIHIAKQWGMGPLKGKKIEAFRYFDSKLGAVLTHLPTTYIPSSWQRCCVDFATRRVESDLLFIDVFRVSVGPQKGIKKWQSVDKFFKPEDMSLYIGGYVLKNIRWGFHWIGPEGGKPDWFPSRQLSAGSVSYNETYIVFSAVASPKDVDGVFIKALELTSSLKRQ
ncbi:hypothetical protein SELMODRAFT_443302 [Selaginella moellendorffii]|uniref:Uncharacterized protein n=1 Tax=Selaginella moellendorffii TaxID=88036 RepID=D8S0C0_SELML|nr:hypothetical protein SELMODRAFT_443302 [Selaginella moellendorffii]